MSVPDDLRRLIRDRIDRDSAVHLLRRAVGTPSITGAEAAFAQLVAEELRAIGAAGVTVEDFLPGRPNVWGVRKGAGSGRSLMLIGHLDTVHVRGWAERWAGTERADPFGAAIVDDRLWGRGSGDLKAGVCAGLAALATLDRCGVRLAGDVVCAYPGDEESGEPGSGISAGMKALVPMIASGVIPKADFAIYCEPTRLDVYTAQMGFFIADIAIEGRSAYFGVPEEGVDAVRAAHAVLAALWRHSAELEARPPHELVGRPFLLVTGIEGGGYIAVPGRCTLSLIRKLLPGEDLTAARGAFEAVVRGVPADPAIRIAITYPAGRDHEVGGTACEIDPGHEAVRLLQAAIEGTIPGRGRIEGAPYWSEAAFTVQQLGIPTVYCAPGDITNCHTTDEHVEIAEYLAAIEAYAVFIAAHCGMARTG